MQEANFTQQHATLLIEISTKLNRALQDIEALNKKLDDSNSRYAEKHAVEELRDSYEKFREYSDKRTTWLERIAYGGISILVAIEFYFKYLDK